MSNNIMPLKYVTGGEPNYEYYTLCNFKTNNTTFLNIYFGHNDRLATNTDIFGGFVFDILNTDSLPNTLIKDNENKCFYTEVFDYDNNGEYRNVRTHSDYIKEGINIEYLGSQNYKIYFVEKNSPLIGNAFMGVNDNNGIIEYDKESLLNFLSTQNKDIEFTVTSIYNIGYKPNVYYLNSNKIVGASGLFRALELLREHLKENNTTISVASNEDIDAMFK